MSLVPSQLWRKLIRRLYGIPEIVRKLESASKEEKKMRGKRREAQRRVDDKILNKRQFVKKTVLHSSGKQTEESRSMTSLWRSMRAYKYAVSPDRPDLADLAVWSSRRSLDMLSHSLLVNTGNVLSLSETRQKASQNSTDEVSWQLSRNRCAPRSARGFRVCHRATSINSLRSRPRLCHTFGQNCVSRSSIRFCSSWSRLWRSSWTMNEARGMTRQLYVYQFSAIGSVVDNFPVNYDCRSMEGKTQVCKTWTEKIWRSLWKYLSRHLMSIRWRKRWIKVHYYIINRVSFSCIQCVLYFVAFKALSTDTIESLVIAYKSAEAPEDILSSLKKIWSVIEEYVRAEKLSSVGLSDINTNTFIELFQWDDVSCEC